MSDGRSSGRLLCVVPHCPRSTKTGTWEEWLCGRHYCLVDRRLKSLRRRFRARATSIRNGPDYRRGWVHLRLTRAKETDDRIWERMKRQAIERAMGISA